MAVHEDAGAWVVGEDLSGVVLQVARVAGIALVALGNALQPFSA